MLIVQANRAKALFKQAGKNINKKKVAKERRYFSYWCTFYGDNPDARPDSFKLVDRKVYNQLESKRAVAAAINEHRIQGVFPATFTDSTSAKQYQKPVNVWFVKPSHLSGGRGISLIKGSELAEFELPPHHIIQEGIEGIRLYQNKKYTLRVYLLVWDNRIYLYDEGFAVIHAPEYIKGSVDYKIQVDHKGYEKAGAGVQMKLISQLPRHDNVFAQSERLIKKMWPVLDPVVQRLTII